MNVHMPAWSTVELDIMRAGLGFVVVVTFAGIQFFRPTGEPSHPVGIARFVDLRWTTSRTAVRWIQYVAYAGALSYAAGLAVPVAVCVLAATTVVEVTLRSSYGSVNHGYHLLAIVLTAQAVAMLLWSAAEHWDWDLGVLLASSRDATAAWWTVQAIVAVYFTSGISKLVNTRGRWIHDSPGLLLSAYGRIDTDRMSGQASWGTSGRAAAQVSWLLIHPVVTQCLFAAGLFIELTAPVGLLSETLLLLSGLALIALHQGNDRLLGLPFPEYQLLVLVYLVNVPQFFC
jgi:hypothetical protein